MNAFRRYRLLRANRIGCDPNHRGQSCQLSTWERLVLAETNHGRGAELSSFEGPGLRPHTPEVTAESVLHLALSSPPKSVNGSYLFCYQEVSRQTSRAEAAHTNSSASQNTWVVSCGPLGHRIDCTPEARGKRESEKGLHLIDAAGLAHVFPVILEFLPVDAILHGFQVRRD